MDLMDLMEMNIEMEISMIYPQTSEIYNGNGKNTLFFLGIWWDVSGIAESVKMAEYVHGFDSNWWINDEQWWI